MYRGFGGWGMGRVLGSALEGSGAVFYWGYWGWALGSGGRDSSL